MRAVVVRGSATLRSRTLMAASPSPTSRWTAEALPRLRREPPQPRLLQPGPDGLSTPARPDASARLVVPRSSVTSRLSPTSHLFLRPSPGSTRPFQGADAGSPRPGSAAADCARAGTADLGPGRDAGDRDPHLPADVAHRRRRRSGSCAVPGWRRCQHQRQYDSRLRDDGCSRRSCSASIPLGRYGPFGFIRRVRLVAPRSSWAGTAALLRRANRSLARARGRRPTPPDERRTGPGLARERCPGGLDWRGVVVGRGAVPGRVRGSAAVPAARRGRGRSAWKQIIPYLVLRDGPRIFLMRRTRAGGDERLHDRYSIGVGGHVNPEDGDVVGGLRREWAEEIEADFEPEFRPSACSTTTTTPVGAVHLGLVFGADAARSAGGYPRDRQAAGAFATARRGRGASRPSSKRGAPALRLLGARPAVVDNRSTGIVDHVPLDSAPVPSPPAAVARRLAPAAFCRLLPLAATRRRAGAVGRGPADERRGRPGHGGLHPRRHRQGRREGRDGGRHPAGHARRRARRHARDRHVRSSTRRCR